MKKITVLLFCIILIVSLTACGSDTTSDENADNEVATEESVSEDVEEETEPYSVEWPDSHREMLRNPDDFTGKTVYCSGEIAANAQYDDTYKALIVRNKDDSSELCVILYTGELNENPLEGDHVYASGTFEKLYEQSGSAGPMIKSNYVSVDPEN